MCCAEAIDGDAAILVFVLNRLLLRHACRKETGSR